MIGLYGFGIYLVKLGRVFLTLFVRGLALTIWAADITIFNKGLDFPGGAGATDPTFLLGANGTVPTKTAINAAGRALVSATTAASARALTRTKPSIYAGLDIIEHFIGATNLAGNLATSTSTGTAAAQVTDGRVGVLRLTCSATATNNARANLGWGSSDSTIDNVVTTPFLFVAEVTPAVALFSGGSPGLLLVGFVDTDGTGLPTDGAYFRCDDGGFWQIQTKRNSTTTSLTTAVQPVVGTWTQMAIRLSGVLAEFWIDGVLVGTIDTNLPGGSGRQTGIMLTVRKTSAHTTNCGMDVDYIRFTLPTTAIIA
jgi:Concanavalin A-like lectin/glucanases superfamily